MNEESEKLEKSEKVSVGAKVRALRKIRGISLQQLSQEIGMSYSYLSSLENDKHSVSITNLQRLANYFQVDMVHFLTPSGPVPRVFRGGDLFSRHNEYEDFAYRVVTPANANHLQVSYASIPPFQPGERNIHKHGKGQEMILVLDGVVYVMVEEERYQLERGDCIVFESEMEHAIFTEDVGATIVIVSSPPYGQELLV